MLDLPKTVSKYKETNHFNEVTVPKGLLKDHSTAKNVWGKINILEGEIEYTICKNPVEVVLLDREKSGIVEPEQLHFIKPLGKVLFYVEFYR